MPLPSKKAEDTPGQPSTGLVKIKQMRTLIGQMEQQIKAAVPKYLDPSRFVRVVLTLYNQNYKLHQCSDISFLAAVMTAAQLGLEPDGILGEGYIIPYGNRAQFQTGYKGLLKLARNAGNIKDVQLEVVYAKDKFTYKKGLEPILDHEPSEDVDPGPITHVYMIVRFLNGGFQYKVMTRAQIERHRDRYSKAYAWDLKNIEKTMNGKLTREKAIEELTLAQKLSPWFTNEEAMFKKTVAIQCCKLLDLSPEARKQIAREEHLEQGLDLPVDLSSVNDDVIESTAEDVKPDKPAGELTAPPSRSDELAERISK